MTVSCSKVLKETPYSFLTPENFPLTASDADAALAGGYNVMQDYSTFRYIGTYALAFQNDILHTGSAWAAFLDAGVEFYTPLWEKFYQGINSCNNVVASLEKIDPVANPWTTAKIAEAKALRAFYYFYLVRFFGDIPLTLEPSVKSVVIMPRTEVPEVYTAIVNDLVFAEGKLSNNANSGGHLTNGAVKSLLAQVYATMAGWRRTPAGQMVQGDAANWVLARDKAKEVIDMENAGIYKLDPDYKMIFVNLSTDVYDPEIIFDVEFSTNQLTTFPYIFGPPGVNNDAVAANGEQASNARCQIEWIRTLDNRDERYKWNIGTIYYDDKGSWHTIPITDVSDSNSFTVNCYQKWPASVAPDRDWAKYIADGYWENYYTNYPLIRLADIKLLYAEAINEVSGPTAEAYAQINQIRYRARPTDHKTDGTVLPDLSGLSQQQFREAIMAERAIEMPLEGNPRKFDLIRWGNLKEMVDAHKSQLVWTSGGGMDLRYYLAPIPAQDLELNGWTQNAGY